MDSCALIMVGIKDVRLLEARMTFAMARVTVLEMSRVFETKPAMNLDRLSRMDFEKLAACLSEAGLVWSNQEEAERRHASFRAIYEPLLQVLSNYLLLPLPGWLPDRGLQDNWQRDGGMLAAWLIESPELASAADSEP